MIVDIHIHCFPDEVAERSVSIRAEKFRIKPVLDGTVSGLKTAMKESGTDVGVLQPIAIKPDQTVKMNRWAASVADEKVIFLG